MSDQSSSYVTKGLQAFSFMANKRREPSRQPEAPKAPDSGGRASRSEPAPIRFAPILVAGLALAAHGGNISGDWILDDWPAVVGNADASGAAPIWQTFLHDYWGRSRPLRATLREGRARSRTSDFPLNLTLMRYPV